MSKGKQDIAIDMLRTGWSVCLCCFVLAVMFVARPAQAACSNPTGTGGQIYYNSSYASMYYCDNTDWVMMGIGAYNPPAIEFDGTNDYLTTAVSNLGWTGLGSKKGTFSAWINFDDFATTGSILRTSGNDVHISASTCCNGQFRARFQNSGGGAIFNLRTTALGETSNWHHLLFSFDTGQNIYHLYLDDEADVQQDTWSADGIADYDDTSVGIGASPTGSDKFDGHIADLWFDAETYLDLSDVANRRKFITASGMPMYLGKDGSLPTGSAPDIFLSGDVTNWHTNKGSGGGFTENGAITYSSSQPADSILTAEGDTTTGLLSHWMFDESTGTNAADSAGSNDGDLINSPTWQPSGGKINGALQFTSSSLQYVSVGDGFTNSLSDFSVAMWIKPSVASQEGPLYYGLNGHNLYPRARLNFSGDIFFQLKVGGENKGQGLEANLIDNVWQHVVLTWDHDGGHIAKSYVNGSLMDTYDFTASGTLDGGVNNPKIGGWLNEGLYFDGLIDDVRVYDRVLSADDVAQLYDDTTCADPAGATGQIIYNIDYAAMQYCNGKEWVAMGSPSLSRVSLPPPSDNMRVYFKLDESTGTTANDDSGSGNDGTLTNGPTWQSTGGIIDGALEFDGVDDYIDMSTPIGSDTWQDFSVATWYKSKQTSPTDDQTIFNFGNTGDYFDLNVTDDAGEQGHVRHHLRDGSNLTQIYSSTSLLDQQWHHVAVTRSDNGINLYIDGQLEAGSTNSFPGVIIDPPDNTAYIGDVPGSTEQLNGYLDDFRIYNRELSASEIADIYNHGSKGGSLVAHWNFDESSGTTAAESVYGNDGTLTGDPTWQSSGGKFDGALDFDGSGDYVDTDTAISNVFDANKGTVTMWVYRHFANSTPVDHNLWWSSVDAANKVYIRYDTSAALWRFKYEAGGSGNDVTVPEDDISQNNWHFVAYTWDRGTGNATKAYVDGALINTNSGISGTWTGTPGIGFIGSDISDRDFDGLVDDVRLYDYVLSADEISDLYNYNPSGGGGCSSPAGVAGQMIYNSDNTVLQYCNGTDWIGIGQ